ncbi:hypothetical protein GCM10027290_20410 [Micromonospora sonneratiae]|uniref:Uncharacterized protein n=1 Tax=Micromonospora sonneratiae TaxID=1184706 RepID=A0ABW3YG13_9ACTN
MIPDEDRGPKWLQGYGEIAANIGRMEEFAANLRDDLIKNYLPHLEYIDADVSVELSPVDVQFRELLSFLTHHRESLVNTTDLVHFYTNETNRFSVAAKKISDNYGEVDAFTAARVKDVEAALGLKRTGGTPRDSTGSPTTSSEVV